MLTVTVGLVGSGKRRTRRPFASRYSVIPSTEVTFQGGRAFAAAGAGVVAWTFFGAACAGSVDAARSRARQTSGARNRMVMRSLLTGAPNTTYSPATRGRAAPNFALEFRPEEIPMSRLLYVLAGLALSPVLAAQHADMPGAAQPQKPVDAAFGHRRAPPPHRDLEPRGAEVLRPGRGPSLRLQPRGGVSLLREGRRARPEGRDAALGDGDRPGRQLQRSGAGRREAAESARRGRKGPRPLGRRPRERAGLRRGARRPLRRRPGRRPTRRRSRATTRPR